MYRFFALFLAWLVVAESAPVRAATNIINPYRFVVAGGPTWYDVETFANTDTTSFGTTDALEWTSVTVTTGGSATKVRIYLGDNSGGGNLKMGLYAAGGGAVLASGTGNIANASSNDNAYFEITFGTPVTVTSATTYIIAWIGDAGATELSYRQRAGTGSWNAKLGFGYATFPAALPGAADFTLARNYAVSLYVQ